MLLQWKSWENIVGKGDIVKYEWYLCFLRCWLLCIRKGEFKLGFQGMITTGVIVELGFQGMITTGVIVELGFQGMITAGVIVELDFQGIITTGVIVECALAIHIY